MLRLTGEIDQDTAHQLQLLGESLSYMGDLPVEIDLQRLISIDDEALGELEVLILDLLDAARDVRVVNASDRIRRQLELASQVLAFALADVAVA